MSVLSWHGPLCELQQWPTYTIGIFQPYCFYAIYGDGLPFRLLLVTIQASTFLMLSPQWSCGLECGARAWDSTWHPSCISLANSTPLLEVNSPVNNGRVSPCVPRGQG